MKMKRTILVRLRTLVTGLTVFSLAACGGGGDTDLPNSNPEINTLTASPNPTDTSTETTISWNVSDDDGDAVSCSLDVDNDSVTDYTIADCISTTSLNHTYNTENTYMARLTADDGNGGSAQRDVTIVVDNDLSISPVISSFTVNPNRGYINSAVLFSWNVSDANLDTLTCSLDVDNDGTTDYTINDCANNTSRSHTYTMAGNYSAVLSVDDGGNGGSDQASITSITQLEPINVEVSVDTVKVVAGERIHYSITVANAGGIPVDGVNVRMNVPTGISFHQVFNTEPTASSGCGSSCSAGSAPNWIIGSIDAGGSVTIDIDALVSTSVLDGTVITAPITISATNFNDVIINKDVQVENTPLAEMNLSASTDPIIPGQTFTYHVDVGNISPGTLTSLQMQTLLPAGLSVTSISDGGSEVNPGEVVWDVASLNVQSGLRRSVTVMADSNLLAGQVLTAQTDLTHSGGTSENTAEYALTVVNNSIPLSVDLAVVEGPVAAGERLQYNLTLSNPSNLPVDGISLVLRVPEEINFHQAFNAEPNANSGCGSSCLPRSEARWNIGTIQEGGSRTITVDALVATSVPEGSLIATPIRVEAANLNDTIELLKVTQVGTPSTEVVFSASTDPVVPGETFNYTVDIGNISTGTLTNMQVRTLLPAGVSVASISHGGSEINPGEVVWDIASLNVQSGVQRSVSVVADSNLVAGQTLAAKTELRHDGGMEVDNVADHALTVVATAIPLNVELAVAQAHVEAGKRLRYNVTLSNPSSLPVDGISMVMRVPEEISFHQVFNAEPTANMGCGSSCLPRSEARWDVGTLQEGESRTITVDALVATSVPEGSLIAMPVRIEATNQNDTIDLFKVNLVAETFAEVAMSASTDPVVPGETFTYSVDVGNISTGTLTNLEVRTFLPAGVSVASIDNGGVEVAPGEIVWSLGSLNVVSTTQFNVDVIASPGLNGGEALKAKTELRHNGGQAIDNVAEHTVNVVATASPLTVSFSANPNPVVVGGASFYTIMITNTSALPADAVEMVFRVPEELNFHQVFDAEPNANAGCGSSCLPTNEARFSLGTIPAGMTQTILIDMNIATTATAGGLIVSPIRVTSSALENTIDREFVVPIQ